ncbi:MAG: DUF6737 family protein [Prochlorotrichaceae cyanobacterium]|jgi:membrane protein YdbS with pleckstrin-like domain
MNPDPIQTETPQPIDIWKLKPWWCQPWSIVLTTIALPSLSWLGFHQVWLTGGLAVILVVWMSFFLGVYPKMVQALYSEDPQ